MAWRDVIIKKTSNGNYAPNHGLHVTMRNLSWALLVAACLYFSTKMSGFSICNNIIKKNSNKYYADRLKNVLFPL